MGLPLCLLGLTLLPVYGTAEKQASTTSRASGDGQQTVMAPTTELHQEMMGKEAGAVAPQEEQASEEVTLVEQLRARLMELNERERHLREEEHRFEKLQQDLDALKAEQAKAAEAFQAQRDKAQAQEQADVTQESLARLVKVYEAMDPEEAALRIQEMKEKLALDILAGIKPQKAANVLAGVEAQKAARLSEGLRYYTKTKGAKQAGKTSKEEGKDTP